jgi:hypothetical protein
MRKKRTATDPVQNVGQALFKATPLPWGNQAERYGLLTANGTEGGLKGIACQVTFAAALVINTVEKSNAYTSNILMVMAES